MAGEPVLGWVQKKISTARRCKESEVRFFAIAATVSGKVALDVVQAKPWCVVCWFETIIVYN